MVRYGSYWYLSATFGGEVRGRSCQILRSATPEGPYQPFSPPITPKGWHCLDGHLFFGESEPCIVFCREWTEVEDGQMYCARLSYDLSCMVGDPVLLFHASDAPWTTSIRETENRFVTDGPFLWQSRATKELLMLWSSFKDGVYCIGIARSCSGSVFGPWTHDTEPILEEDGGHCMLFRLPAACPPLWDGSGLPPLIMALHQPNANPMRSRAMLYLVKEEIVDGKCHLKVDGSKRIH